MLFYFFYKLKEHVSPITKHNMKMMLLQGSQEDDPFEAVFSKRGEVQKASGSKKVVSTFFQSHADADADAVLLPPT